jgi:hypothetical protein
MLDQLIQTISAALIVPIVLAMPLAWLGFVASIIVVGQHPPKRPLSPADLPYMPTGKSIPTGFDPRPTLYALGLALLSAPIVAASLNLFDAGTAGGGYPVALALDDPRRVLCAVPVVLASAFVASSLGAIAMRRQEIAGFVITLALAILTAIGTLALVLELLPQQTQEGRFCIDSCSAILGRGADGPAWAIAFFGWAPLMEMLPVSILCVGVLVWALLVRRGANRREPNADQSVIG